MHVLFIANLQEIKKDLKKIETGWSLYGGCSGPKLKQEGGNITVKLDLMTKEWTKNTDRRQNEEKLRAN